MSLGIKVAMRQKAIVVNVISAVLQIHPNSAANKINGETSFKVEEALKLQEDLFPEYTLRYLFTDVQEY